MVTFHFYLDSENWFKSSIEFENEQFSRLSSVVTNMGHSDWATRDIELPGCIWFRLSRRGPDFLIESSFDGVDFVQMRIFHLHCLGSTSVEMGASIGNMLDLWEEQESGDNKEIRLLNLKTSVESDQSRQALGATQAKQKNFSSPTR